jgi:hypothetical protein
MLCAPTPTNLSVGDIKFEEHDYCCLRYSLYHRGDAIRNWSQMPAELSKSSEQKRRPTLR